MPTTATTHVEKEADPLPHQCPYGFLWFLGLFLLSCQGLEERCCLKPKNDFDQVAFLTICGVCNLSYSPAVAAFLSY